MNKKTSTALLFAAFLTGNSVFAVANQKQVSIGVQDTLYVRIIDMLPEPFYQDFRFIDEYDRYFYLKDSVAQVFEKAEIPIERHDGRVLGRLIFRRNLNHESSVAAAAKAAATPSSASGIELSGTGIPN